MSRPLIPSAFSSSQQLPSPSDSPNPETPRNDLLSPPPNTQSRPAPLNLRPASLQSGSARALTTLSANHQHRRGTVSFAPSPAEPSPPPKTPIAVTATGIDDFRPPQQATSPRGRSRAHTVSVCLPSSRNGPVSSPRTADVEMAMGRRSSRTSARRGSIVSQVSVGDLEIENANGELHDEVVGMLDVVDPQVATVNSLQHMTNSILIPHFPALWSRRPEVVLPQTPSDDSLAPLVDDGLPTTTTRRRSSTTRSRSTTLSRIFPATTSKDRTPSISLPTTAETDALDRQQSIPHSPALSVEQQNILALDEDTEELQKDHELDRHVKHVLTKRDKARRVLKGLWQFIKTPMGAITAIYGFLVAFWGAAIVLFLLGWINAGSKEENDIWVEISSQVENGLFTVTGIGLIPWRVIDTYRIYIVWKLKRLTVKRRAERGLPPIEDPDDLPDPRLIPDYVYVLTDKEQEQLRYQQEKFSASQTWYKPHATATHRAFPISWALWNTVLMDGNSFFQCILCGCMWGLNRHTRPAWTTGTLIPCSFLCGIGAAILIWRGGVKTKKRETVEDKLRQALGVPLAISMPNGVESKTEKSIFQPKTPTSASAASVDSSLPLFEKRNAVTSGNDFGDSLSGSRGSLGKSSGRMNGLRTLEEGDIGEVGEVDSSSRGRVELGLGRVV